ncbi:tRNA(fMet)-specific endonuclease VapC [uncultured archaeon]|nr:tRNA(fMet)-specific endonuclease VapC [uncultured archaeon]
MSGRFLLDTNIIIALFADDPSVKKKLVHADEVFISSTVLGELYFGAHKSKHVKKNLSRIEDFASNSAVLPCDTDTASIYGLIKKRLLEKGKPIPENDIWIAAVAYQHGLTVVSRDGHFNEVEEMKFETW